MCSGVLPTGLTAMILKVSILEAVPTIAHGASSATTGASQRLSAIGGEILVLVCRYLMRSWELGPNKSRLDISENVENVVKRLSEHDCLSAFQISEGQDRHLD